MVTLERINSNIKLKATRSAVAGFIRGLNTDELAVAKVMFDNEYARLMALPRDERESEALRLIRDGGRSVQAGAIGMTAIVGIMVGIVVVGAALPVLWPMITSSDTDIQAMNGTDDGTVFIQTFWPIIILIAGIGIAVMVIKSAMKKGKVG